MPLALLFATPILSTSYDATSDILVLEWQGQLTLLAVQLASVQLAQGWWPAAMNACWSVPTRCGRLGGEVAGRLGHMLLLSLPAAGIKWLAWMGSGSPGNVALAQYVLTRLPAQQACLWADVEQATDWLQSPTKALAAPAPPQGPARNLPRLRRRATILNWRVLTALARHPRWLLVAPPARYATAARNDRAS